MVGEAKRQIERVQMNGHKAVKVLSSPRPLIIDKNIILSSIKQPEIKSMMAYALDLLLRVQNQEVDRDQALMEIATTKQIIALLILNYNNSITQVKS